MHLSSREYRKFGLAAAGGALLAFSRPMFLIAKARTR